MRRFVECRCLIYIGIASRILVGRGTCFVEWLIVCGKFCNIDESQTGIESYNLLGIDERYNHLLRNMFRKISITYPHASKERRLAMAVKAMNDSFGPMGIVTSALIFGGFLQMRVQEWFGYLVLSWLTDQSFLRCQKRCTSKWKTYD